jgi:aminocarboxymuconate-semialdehyde decarboxylase
LPVHAIPLFKSTHKDNRRMRHIDAFCHFFPAGIFKLMSGTAGGTTDVGKRMQGVRTIYDLDARFRMMDEFKDYSQILSLGLPPLEGMAGPDRTPEFARVANDGLAELCAKYPDRFAGYVGALPMDVPDAAAREAERILVDGNANGLQLHTNVNGHCLDEARFFPIFEIAAKSGKPILLHPARKPDFPDFAAEKSSKYEIWTIFGWPYETSATMARLIFSGVMTKLPSLKILAHHLGAMIPFFDERIATGWATLGSRTSGEDYSHVLPSLGKPLLDCFKDFYGDTALCGGRIGLTCGLAFYGVDHVLYASDAPFGAEGGAHYIRSQMAAVAALDIPTADKEKICCRNALAFFGLE